MREYFESAWRAYRRLRPGAPPRPPAGLFARFARLRPLVESGWEMPVLIHALRAGASRASRLRDWRPDAWLADLAATREAVGAALDRVRDEWIAHDETGWLASPAFYPGVIERPRRAAGGYNTADDRATARNDGRIVLLTLARFARTFSAWVTY